MSVALSKTVLVVVIVLGMCAACARAERETLMPQRQEALDRREACQRTAIGNPDHDRDCRDAVPL